MSRPNITNVRMTIKTLETSRLRLSKLAGQMNASTANPKGADVELCRILHEAIEHIDASVESMRTAEKTLAPALRTIENRRKSK